MLNHKYYWLFFLLLVISFGCDSSKVFEEYKKMDKFSWYRFNNLEFDVLIEDTETEYDVFILFRHLPEFPHHQLPINLTIYSPSGEVRSANHLLDLYDDEGNRLSECMGDFCDVAVLARKEITFYEPGTFRFMIENKWKKVDLPGIMEVGLMIRKSK